MSEIPPHAALSALADGFVRTQLVYVAAALGVADAIGGDPAEVATIARQVGADPGRLHRVLRGLAADGVVVEHPGARFSLSPIGDLLRRDHPNSMRDFVLSRGSFYWQAASALLEGVKHGRVPFEISHGVEFFEYLKRHPDDGARFDGSMMARSGREAAAVANVFDFTPFRRIVDVGGGVGDLVAAALESAPDLRGVLVDRPPVVERARARISAAGLEHRCDCVGGDFFVEVPAGGDLYALSRVLHDWGDEAAGTILRACVRAMAPHARLLVVEALVPERAVELPSAISMDLYMLILLSSRERTQAEFEELLSSAGLRLVRATPTAAGVHVLESELA